MSLTPGPATVAASPEGRQAAAMMGFCVSHAPQIFLGPPEEDPAELAKVHDGYRLIAHRASELSLDAVCVVALDHLHNHFLNLIPMFTVFVGDPVVAEFTGTRVTCDAAPELANALLDALLDAGFDPAFSQREVLDHSFMIPLHYARGAGLSVPVIPLIVNAYVPPQPSIRRCYELGRALARWAARDGVRLGVVATGGMSHYPGTDLFHHPDVASDQEVLGWLTGGQADRLVGLSAAELDRRGMVELRTWAVALGARGSSAKAAVHSYWDSGHCGYAVIEL
jgi:aromatic ring-opening dioxygenase catalytic subunit (LigB family)